MEKFSRKLANKMVLQNIISHDDFDIYAYYLQIKIEKAIFLILLSLMALIMRCFIEVVVFYLFYSMIRQNSGGFHCKTYLGCLTLSLLTVFLIILLGKNPLILNCQGGVILSGIFVICIGAINSPCIDWSVNEYKIADIRTRIVTIVELVVICVFRLLGVPNMYLYFAGAGIVLSAISLLVEIIKQKGGHEHEEQD